MTITSGSSTQAQIAAGVSSLGFRRIFNPIQYSSSGYDPTGVSDSSGSWQAVINAAAASSLPSTICFDDNTTLLIGTSAFFPQGSHDITIDLTGVTLKASSGNTAFNGALILSSASGPVPAGLLYQVSHITIKGTGTITADPANTVNNTSIRIYGPSNNFSIENGVRFKDLPGGAVVYTGGTNFVTGHANGTQTVGQNTIALVSSTGFAVGGQIFGNGVYDGLYVSSIASNTLTLAGPGGGNLTSSLANNSAIFQPATMPVLTANAGSNVVTLNGIVAAGVFQIGETVYSADTPTATSLSTVIQSIATAGGNTVLTLNKPLTAVPAYLMAMAGIKYSKVNACFFDNIGNGGVNQPDAQATTTNGTSTNASNILNLTVATAAYLYVGNATSAISGNLPAGVPTNNPITAINYTTGAVTLLNPLTQDVLTGLSVSFRGYTNLSNCSNAITLSNGHGANVSNTVSYNQFTNIGASGAFVYYQTEFEFSHNTYRGELGSWRKNASGQTFGVAGVSPNVSRRVIITGNRITGATGNGIDIDTIVGLTLTDNISRGNGGSGCDIGQGDITLITGNQFTNNYQSVNWSSGAQNTSSPAALTLHSISVQPATQFSNSSIDNNWLGDDQAVPTQKYGIYQPVAGLTTNVFIGQGNQGLGNTSALLVSGLPPQTKAPAVVASSGVVITNTGIATTEVNHASVAIPDMGPNDSIEITSLWSTAGTATNTKNILIRLSGNSCTPGQACTNGSAVLNTTLNTTGGITQSTLTVVRNTGVTNAQVFFGNSNTSGTGNAATAAGTSAIETKNGGFINFDSITATSSADTVKLLGYTVKIIPGV